MADISLADIKKLRDMTSAGMMDCKKALTEAEGEKGKSTLAKRGDNETTQGAVLARVKGNQAILVCLGCETDFVAATPDFKFLAETIATEAISEFPASLEELKAQKTASGYTLEEDITNQAGKTGEKHVLAYYAGLEAPFVTEYVHFNGKLGAIVAFNKEIPASIARGIAMQVASMNPVAVDEASVPAEVLESEKTKAANLPAQMIENIAKGRVAKFLKENTLLEQEYQLSDNKETVKAALAAADSEAKVLSFKRFSLAD